MRCMDKSRHGVFVSRFEGKRPETDSQGRLTGRHEMSYTEPVEVLASVSSAKGQAQDSMFGLNLDYDRIIAIDDTAVSSTSTVKSYLADKQVGDTVTLQVERDGKVLTLNVTLGNSAQ